MSASKTGTACHFCHQGKRSKNTGKLLKLPDNSVIAHSNCMLYSPNVVTSDSCEGVLGGFDVESVKKEIQRGRKMKCWKCKEKGATIGCHEDSCKKTYHYSCGLSRGIYFEDSTNEKYELYCKAHKDAAKTKYEFKETMRIQNDLDDDDDDDDDDYYSEDSDSSDDKITLSAKKRKKKYKHSQYPRRKKTKKNNTTSGEESTLFNNRYSSENSPYQPSTSFSEQPATSRSYGYSQNHDHGSNNDSLHSDASSITIIMDEGKNMLEEKLHSSKSSSCGVVDSSPYSRNEPSDSDMSNDLPSFDGSNITPKICILETEEENVSAVNSHPSEQSPRCVAESSLPSLQRDSDSEQTDNSDSLLSPNLILARTTSLSKKWRKQNAKNNGLSDSVTVEERDAYDKIYAAFGGSLPINDANEIGNEENMEETPRGNNYPTTIKDKASGANTSETPVSHSVEPLESSAIKPDMAGLKPSGSHDVQMSSNTQSIRFSNLNVTPRVTSTPKAKQTFLTHSLKETQQKGYPSARGNLMHRFNEGSNTEGTLVEQSPSTSFVGNMLIAHPHDSEEKETSVAQNANSKTKRDKLKLKPVIPVRKDSSVTAAEVLRSAQQVINNSNVFSPEIQRKFSNMASKINKAGKSKELPDSRHGQVNSTKSTQTIYSCLEHQKNGEGIGKITIDCKESGSQTSSVNPETDVSSINFNSSQNADLFIQYKEIKEQMSNVGVDSLQDGLCKEFWDVCQQKNCLELFLEHMKCSIESITQKIREGEAVEQEYKQAFLVLMGSRCLEGLVLKETEEIQQRILCIEEEKKELSAKIQLLTGLFS
ncbi:PHD finger protein 11 [Pelobates fuscus]|uniref:PHD finger protein 11 n=1 Tax=Pelobates fuscus TaxID=191477 RepID=UPI002FE4937D